MESVTICVNLMVFGTFYTRLYQKKCCEVLCSWLLPYVQQKDHAEESLLRS